jgi:DNA processing protein
MSGVDQAAFDMLRLTLVPGLGPVLIGRAIRALGSAAAVLEASETALRSIKGFGPATARAVVASRADSAGRAEAELAAVARAGARIVPIGSGDYPPLLAQIPDPPPLLYVAGDPGALGRKRYPVAIVGSRSCTPYGIEQAERFALHLAQAGLTVVSGGARGIDTAAHRGALRAASAEASGLTVAVLGCGLANRYPPDNADLFDRIVASGGALVSELPMNTAPASENFPSRNRIISGVSLGVLVIEAGRGSGALITARDAAEDHGREVFALPGRVDSAASEGSLGLIKAGGAAMVTHPSDVLDALESAARHHYMGTHADRFAAVAAAGAATDGAAGGGDGADDLAARSLFDSDAVAGAVPSPPPAAATWPGVTPAQRAILEALTEPVTVDELARATGLEPGLLRAELTMLEIGRRVRRSGTRVARA